MTSRDPAPASPGPEPNDPLAAEPPAEPNVGAPLSDDPRLPVEAAQPSAAAQLSDADPVPEPDRLVAAAEAEPTESWPPPAPAVTSWLASAEGEVPVVPPTWLASAEPGTVPAYVDDPYARAARAGSFAPFASAGDAATQTYVLDVEPLGPAHAIEAAAVEARRRRGFPMGRLVLAFVAGLLLVGVVAVGALYAYDQQYSDRILPGVHVGSVDVSGLDRATASNRLAAAYASFGQGSVVISLEGATTTISYSDLHRRADLDAMLEAAFAVGRSASPIERVLQELRTSSRGVTLEPRVLVDGSVLTDRITQLVNAADQTVADATVFVTPTGFGTTPARVGQRVEAGTGAADAAAQLARLDAPSQILVTLAVAPLQPSITDQAVEDARAQAERMAHDVTLADGDDRWVIPAATVHGWLSFEMLDGKPHATVDVKAVLAAIKPFAPAMKRDPAEATLFVNPDGKTFGTTPSTDGRALNASKTTTVVVNAVRARATGGTLPSDLVQPVLTITRPSFTTEEAVAAAPKMVVISEWTTNYQPSDRNGFGINIKLPTAKIDTYVVAPHQTFSFWKAVGPVTRELGYTDGGAIIDGHTEPQGALGGGICSCSTTLFNAALRAGFQMGDRLNHYYYIPRYPLGLDATVFISAAGDAQDMSWTNDTDMPVVIRGINGPTSVKFVLYGIPNGRTVTFTKPIVKNYKPAHTVTVYTDALPAGTKKQIEYQVDGQDVWVTRTVTDASGTIIHQEEYYSHYAVVTGVIQIGGKDPNAKPAPAPVTTSP